MSSFTIFPLPAAHQGEALDGCMKNRHADLQKSSFVFAHCRRPLALKYTWRRHSCLKQKPLQCACTKIHCHAVHTVKGLIP
jgi:hypothetical protein